MEGLLYLALVVLLGLLIALVEGRKAPEGWICPRCQGEVIDYHVCMWCGHVKGRE